MHESFKVPPYIAFEEQDGYFVTQLGDIEVQVIYDHNGWQMQWYEYEETIQCATEWWCSQNNCDLDALDLTTLAPDEYCIACPRIKSVQILSEASCNKAHTVILCPQNIEDVRKNIMSDYVSLAHNDLNKKNLQAILSTQWIVQ